MNDSTDPWYSEAKPCYLLPITTRLLRNSSWHYWAFVKTEYLTTATKLPCDLRCPSWTRWSGPPSHKVGHAQQHSIIKWKWHLHDWAHAGPESTRKLHKEVAQMPKVLKPAFNTFLLTVYTYGLIGVPYHQLTKGIKGSSGLQMALHDLQPLFPSWTAVALWPLWGPCASDSISKEKSYWTHWGDCSWLPRGNWTTLHNGGKEDYVWNIRDSLEFLVISLWPVVKVTAKLQHSIQTGLTMA